MVRSSASGSSNSRRRAVNSPSAAAASVAAASEAAAAMVEASGSRVSANEAAKASTTGEVRPSLHEPGQDLDIETHEAARAAVDAAARAAFDADISATKANRTQSREVEFSETLFLQRNDEDEPERVLHDDEYERLHTRTTRAAARRARILEARQQEQQEETILEEVDEDAVMDDNDLHLDSLEGEGESDQEGNPVASTVAVSTSALRQGFEAYVWPSTGDRYKGYWLNDRMHGYGEFKWSNGDIYEGQWVEGKMCGKGRKAMANGDVYDGMWRDDKAHGYGVKVFANGDRHEGLYLNDKREGNGVYRWVNQDVYKGEWKDGKMCGKGVKYMANKDVYKGEWCNDKAHGYGVKEFACGDIHVGNYMFDKREGFGTYTWKNGDRYQGQWKDGRMNGRGVKTMANGDIYDGEWKDDKADGYGTKSFACGDRHAGEYRDDRRHGYGVYQWANRDKYEGWWIKAEQSGDGTYYYSNGDVFKGRWLAGKKHGPGTFTSAGNNTSYLELWENGVRAARERTTFHPSRMLRTERKCSGEDADPEETRILRAEIDRLKAVLETSPAIVSVPLSPDQLSRVKPLELLRDSKAFSMTAFVSSQGGASIANDGEAQSDSGRSLLQGPGHSGESHRTVIVVQRKLLTMISQQQIRQAQNGEERNGDILMNGVFGANSKREALDGRKGDDHASSSAAGCDTAIDFTSRSQPPPSSSTIYDIATTTHYEEDDENATVAVRLTDEQHRLWTQYLTIATSPPRSDMCKICYERPVNVVLIRCGHMCSCLECSSRVERCPICRQRIQDVVRTYRV